MANAEDLRPGYVTSLLTSAHSLQLSVFVWVSCIEGPRDSC